jgi:predicted Zn-dependent protease
MHNMTKAIAVCLLVLTGFFAGGCAKDAQVMQAAAGMHNQLEPAVIEDPQLANYLQQVGDRIIAAAAELDKQGYGPKSHKSEKTGWMFKDMKFHFVNSKTLNAFTTGGEHMYIYTQLFEQAKTEDELAAVMAHEYGHVYARHVGKGMNRQYGAMAAAAALAGAGYVAGGKEHGGQYAALGATAGMAGGQFINMGFTRHDEDEADKLGFDFYTRAGWDPNKFDDFFQQMIDQGLDTTPEMMSDHPSLKNRVTATKERVKQLPPTASDWRKPPIASPEQFKALQARAAELGKTLPSDATLSPGSQQLLAALPRSCLTPIVQPDEIKARENLAKQAEEAQKKQQSGQGQPQQTPPAKKKKQQSAAAAPAPADAIPAGATLPPSQQVISSPR